MTRQCDKCGCPLGEADIAAAQCPVCRKTLWRHVIDGAPEKSSQPDKAPAYYGTLVAPVFPETESEDFGDAFSDRSVPAERRDDVPPTLSSLPDAGALEELSSASALGRTTTLPGGSPETTVTVAMTLPMDRQAVPPSRTQRSGADATIDPRNFDEEDQARWDKTLGSPSAEPGGGSPPATTEAGTAGSSRESRYVGKTPVAGRTLARPDQTVSAATDYALGDALGAGGMGVVYEATQRSIDRKVAVKLLRPEVARRRDRRDSLATEAIVTGELTHPNIVPIHDLGQDADGNLFYSMKRVEGARWDQALPEKSQAENLDVFLKVADAIAFAHSRGVVHRDLKPENVLLGGFGEVLVMDWGLAYATDRFKKLDSITSNPATGGSPAYMAPEQAMGFLIAGGWRTGEMPPVTTAIDVYLLGAILFEIAAGSPPHSGADPALCVVAAAENRIREVESASGLLPIALKAMATDPPDRYGSVEELQAAVREFRTHSESVLLADRARSLLETGELARAVVGFEDALELWPENPEATTQVVVARRRLSRRRYALAAMTAAFLIAISVGGFGINHQRLAVLGANENLKDSIAQEKAAKRKAEEANDRAQKEKARAEQAAEDQRLAKEEAQRARDDADAAAEAQRLAKEDAIEAQRDAEIAKTDAERERERQRYQNYQGRIKLIDARIEEEAFIEAERLLGQLAAESPDLCGWEWGRLKYLCTQGRRRFDLDAPPTAAAAAPDGSVAVAGGADGRIRAVRLSSADAAKPGRFEFTESGLGRVAALAISPDGGTIAAAGDGSLDVVLFRAAAPDAAPTRFVTGLGRPPVSLAFSSNGSRLLAAGSGGLVLLDTASGRSLAGGSELAGEPLPLTCAAISSDGTMAAAGLADGQVLVWPTADDGLSVAKAWLFDGHRRGAEFADGFRYAAGEVTALAFLPDRRVLVSGDGEGRLIRWAVDDAAPRRDVRDLAGAMASAVAASRGAEPVPVSLGTKAAQVSAHAGPVRAVAARTAGDGSVTLVTGGADGLVVVWNDVEAWPAGASKPDAPVVLRGHEGPVTAVGGVGPPGEALAVFSSGADATMRLWDVKRYGEVRAVRAPIAASHEQEVLTAAFDPTGRRLMTGGRDETLVISDLDAPGAEPRRSPKVHGEAISVPWVVPFSDGKRLVTGYLDGSLAIWDVAARTTLARVAPGVGSSLTPPAVSPDGRWVASSWQPDSAVRSIAVWSVERLIGAGAAGPDFVFESKGEIFTAAFTSDGKLVFGDRPGPDRPAGGHVYVADLQADTPRTYRIFGDGVEGRVYAVRPLPGGEILAAGTSTVGAAVRVVRMSASTGKVSGPPLALAGGFLTSMAISRDGSDLVTLSNVGGDRVQALEAWDLGSGRRRWEIRRSDARIAGADISPDGKGLLIVSEPVRREGTAMVSAGSSEARLLDLATGEERRFGPAEGEPLLPGAALGSRVSSVSFAMDGGTAFLTAIHGVTEWDLRSRRRVPGTFDSRGAISASGFSSDGRFAIDGHEDGSFDIRDADSPRLTPFVHQPGESAPGSVTAATFSPAKGDYRFFVAAGGSLTLREFDPSERTVSVIGKPLDGATDPKPIVRDAAFSADGGWGAAACDGGEIRIWEIGGQRSPIRLTDPADPAVTRLRHSGAVTAVAFPRVDCPEGFQVVATGGRDRNVIVWVVDTRRGEVAAAVPLRGHRGEIADITFLPGRIDALVSASADTTAKLWDWDRGGIRTWDESTLDDLGEPEEVLTLRGPHTAGLTAVDVSNNGLKILTAGRDGRAVLWPSVSPPR